MDLSIGGTNKDVLSSSKSQFTSGDDIPSIVANDSLSLAGAQLGRRKINRIHNQRRNTGKIVWNDETKQVEIRHDTGFQSPSNEENHDKHNRESSVVDSRSLISRFENSIKRAMPPLPRAHRPKNQETPKKVLTMANSALTTGSISKDECDELVLTKLYEETKTVIDQLTEKAHQLEKDLKERDQVLETLKKAQCVGASLDKQDKRVYEHKISELEEALQKIGSVNADNLRLKEENAALIRIISKFSK